MSTRIKLMGALCSLVFLVVGTSGVLAERSLNKREVSRVARSLEQRAALVLELVRGIPFDPRNSPELASIAHRAASAAGVRVTLIATSGAVVADSDIPVAQLPGVENHSNRPEFRQALRGEIGHSWRRSETVGRRLYYLATPAIGEQGVIRLAVDFSDLEHHIASLRSTLVIAGCIGLVAAVGLSYVLAAMMLRPIHEMRRVAASIAEGELDQRLPRRPQDAIGEISTAINRMAEQLRSRAREATTEKDLLYAVIDGMVEGVLVVDPRDRIVLANHRLCELFDVSPQVRGRSPAEAFGNPNLDGMLRAAAGSSEPVFLELTAGTAAQRTLRAHAVRFSSGSVSNLGTISVFEDITRLTQLEKVRGDFVTNASHEIQTPLAAIRGFAEMLLSGDELANKSRSHVEVIERNAIRLGSLVGDLLELSTIESGTSNIEFTHVDVVNLGQSLISDAEALLEKRSLQITQCASGSTIAYANQQGVEQVLSNLLDNAIKYTDPGGAIALRVEESGAFVRVEVADTGIGIPESELARIFERFYRVDKSRSRQQGSTGLGLSIVRHWVEKMGGEVSVESQIGRGSKFTFTLPRGPAAG